MSNIIDNTGEKKVKRQEAEKYLHSIEKDEIRAKNVARGHRPEKSVSFPPPTKEELEYMKKNKGFF